MHTTQTASHTTPHPGPAPVQRSIPAADDRVLAAAHVPALPYPGCKCPKCAALRKPRPKPKSEALAQVLRQQITNGHYKTRLPPIPVLARTHGVGERTVKTACHLLQAEQLLFIKRRVGMFVRTANPAVKPSDAGP